MITFNSTAAYLWQELQALESFEIEDVSELLVSKYFIDQNTAFQDALSIVKSWENASLIE